MKVQYHLSEPRETYCEVCGELRLCDVLAADYPESETGYLDELVFCPKCGGNGRRTDESPPQEPHGYDRWADIEEVTMLAGQDGQ